MKEPIFKSKSALKTAEKKKSFLDQIDFYLRQVFSKNLVNRFWRLYYSRLRKFLVVFPGAVILALSMQSKATAQLFDNVETGSLDEFLPDGIDLDFFTEFLQLFLLVGGVAAVIGLAFQISRGGSAEVWVSVLLSLVAALVAILLWTGAIYGG